VGPPKPAFSFADFATDARADKANELLQFKQKLKTPVGGGGRKPMPKRKTVRRRTFRVGKSKVHSRVSVLVSNKTIRSRIATDTQLLKQTPMPEVKRYLRKHGLIKVGGSTPPDVLRQMYESAKTMCGEVVNHSPENMLYNFLNDE
jgi:hypothetical protein